MLRRDHGTHHTPLSMASPPLLRCNTASPGFPFPYVVSSPYGGSAEPYYTQRDWGG